MGYMLIGAACQPDMEQLPCTPPPFQFPAEAPDFIGGSCHAFKPTGRSQ